MILYLKTFLGWHSYQKFCTELLMCEVYAKSYEMFQNSVKVSTIKTATTYFVSKFREDSVILQAAEVELVNSLVFNNYAKLPRRTMLLKSFPQSYSFCETKPFLIFKTHVWTYYAISVNNYWNSNLPISKFEIVFSE